MAKQDVTVELFYDADWQDVTSDVYVRDGIKLAHGRADEQAQAPPSSGALTLDNRAGSYNPRNPESALYGKIGRNTPLRVAVGEDVRFVGEVAVWEPRRSLDGADAWAQLTCNGPSRRLGQGSKPLRSALHRELTSRANTGLVAYWPCEDDSAATSISSAIVGAPPMTIIGTPRLAAFDGFAASDPVPDVDGSTFVGDIPLYAVTGETSLRALVSIGENGATDGQQVIGLSMTGTAAEWRIMYNTAGGGSLNVRVRDFDGGLIHNSGAQDFDLDGTLFSLGLEIVQDGADIDYELFVFTLHATGGASGAAYTDTIAGETAGRAKSVIAAGNIGLTGAALGHISVANDADFYADTADALLAHTGEPAGRRFERLCAELDLACSTTGDLDDTSPLGPQGSDAFLDIAHEAAGTDLGILTDAVDAVELHYRTRASLYNQAAALALDFAGAEIAPTLDAAVDDQQVRNDVTAKRRGGGEYRAVDEDGPLGVDAIGRYDTQVQVNVPGEGFLAHHAGWRLHLGTVDDDRWPRVSVDLDAAPSLTAAAVAVRPGDRITLDNLPEHIAGAGMASLLVQGWTEEIGSHRRVITFVCTPGAPWQVAEYESAAGASENKYDTAGSALNEDLTTTETGVGVETLVGPLWTAADDEDGFNIIVGGEVMTVTNVAAAVGAHQNFTVVRSVNGVVKEHATGAPVKLYPAPRYAL
jgi:hypothetical protein